ncbi:MAG: hypothetical protein ACTS22_10520, partial [Phycisphaerales bacterium]
MAVGLLGMPYFLTKATPALYASFADIYDFVWPTAAALWNLRWQVQGYLKARENADYVELGRRFVEGSGIVGANLSKSCVEHSWERQQEQFAEFLLINACALYEAWADQLAVELNTGDGFAKNLQFPTNAKRNRGIGESINLLRANKSTALAASLHPVMCSQSRHNAAGIDHMLKCYRYFKEIRNCIVHGGRVVSDNAVAAYN